MNCRLKAAGLPRCKDVGSKTLLAAWWPLGGPADYTLLRQGRHKDTSTKHLARSAELEAQLLSIEDSHSQKHSLSRRSLDAFAVPT